MELRESALWQEVQSIAFGGGQLGAIYAWKATFKAGNKQVVPFKLISLEVFRDFRQAYGDEIPLEIMMPAGDFIYDLYPHRQNLMVTLSKEGRQRESDSPMLSPDIEAQQLRATLVDDFSVTVEGAMSAAHSREALNKMTPLTIKFQLIDQALERIRLHSVGGVFKDTTPADALGWCLTSVSLQLGLDTENAIKGVEMVESTNTDPYKHMVIPHGTKFPDLPMVFQKKVGGIYPTGLGMYLYQHLWYVYPLYDLTRFDKSTKTLTLINVPKNLLPNVESTYRTTANQIIALVTGDVKHVDRSEAMLMNQGNGVRFLDSRRVVDGFADTSEGENKATVSRAENSSEFVIEQRLSELNNVSTANGRITANKFAEMSKLAQRVGSELQCLWENSDLGTIYPGMPVKYMYIKDDRIHELKGIVLGAQHYVQTHGVGVTETRHRTDTALHLFVSREK